MKKQHLLGKLYGSKESSGEEEEAFISTIFCPNCRERTISDIVEAETHEGDKINIVICIECYEAVNLINDIHVRMYTPSEVIELGWDLFDIISKLEADRWSKIKPWAN